MEFLWSSEGEPKATLSGKPFVWVMLCCQWLISCSLPLILVCPFTSNLQMTSLGLKRSNANVAERERWRKKMLQVLVITKAGEIFHSGLAHPSSNDPFHSTTSTL